LQGWKSLQTVLTVYQQPEMAVQWSALAGRMKACRKRLSPDQQTPLTDTIDSGSQDRKIPSST
jgi:hypothetical protein